ALIPRSRAAIRRRCFKSASGGGARVSQCWVRSPPDPLRRRCSICPAIPKRWIILRDRRTEAASIQTRSAPGDRAQDRDARFVDEAPFVLTGAAEQITFDG